MEVMTSGTIAVTAVECHLFIAWVVYSPVFVIYMRAEGRFSFVHSRSDGCALNLPRYAVDLEVELFNFLIFSQT
jgi:hypothetical protein